ncbi:MAG TPA: response regulator transcription factor [Usitatibacter sp.]|jgi:DNA-binding response OmpR family regulator|nr:response regulator transcription factor [Usitatibacter sp.]
MRILFLEDDPIQLDVVTNWLTSNGHAIVGVSDGKAAMRALTRETFDLAVLDWMVPGVSGQDVLAWIRARELAIPVLFTSSCGGEFETAAMLQLGADDYAIKPLRRLELVARVEALGRRAGVFGAGRKKMWNVGPYSFDARHDTVSINGSPIKLAPRIAKLAIYFFSRVNIVISRAQLYEEIWHQPGHLDTRTLDTHICRLRQLLQLDGRHGVRMSSVYQLGYRLESISIPETAAAA